MAERPSLSAFVDRRPPQVVLSPALSDRRSSRTLRMPVKRRRSRCISGPRRRLRLTSGMPAAVRQCCTRRAPLRSHELLAGYVSREGTRFGAPTESGGAPSRSAASLRLCRARCQRCDADLLGHSTCWKGADVPTRGQHAARAARGFRFRDLSAASAMTVRSAWTAHDDEFSSRDRSLTGGRSAPEEEREPMSSSLVNYIAIIVRRSGAMRLTPC
jgi:hypothetical protein